MMEVVYCIACSYGHHAEHTEVIESPLPGVMGGARCPCKGECDQGRSDRAPGEVETVARAFLHTWDARTLDHPDHPSSHREWADLMESSAEQLRTALEAVRGRSRDDTATPADVESLRKTLYDVGAWLSSGNFAGWEMVVSEIEAVLARFGGAGRPETQEESR